MRIMATLLFVSFLSLALAGCAGGSDAPTLQTEAAGDEICLQVLVVDEEIIPIIGATLTIKGVEGEFSTDDAGRVVVCPLEAGAYELTVVREGYAAKVETVDIAFETVSLTLTLKAIALNVPYHTAQHHVTFVICASFNPVGGVPCTKTFDYVTGQNISGTERFAFPFKIPNENLVDMLVEMTWTPQTFGKDMLFMIQTPPGQPATIASVKYFTKAGGAPLTGWVTAGIKNRCGTGECAGLFDAEPNKITYEGATVWSDGNSTIPPVRNPVDNSKILSGTSLYINHRTEVWMTMFHNRAGSRDYSALPDK